jgi:NAD(P) transhydrogenase subunit beta
LHGVPSDYESTDLTCSKSVPKLDRWQVKSNIAEGSLATGYAGVDNSLFYKESTRMLFGDAKKMLDGILHHLPAG